MNKSVMKCCICNNENIGQFITINNKKYHLCCIEQLKQENKQLRDNWNMLKEHLINRYNNGPESISYRQVFIEIRESMQVLETQQKFELERGNSNE